MTENPQPARRPGGWPVTHPVDLDAIGQATAEQQAEHEYGEQYARYWAAVAWNELVFDITRLHTVLGEK
ncbi:hypothetical protein ACPESV_24610 [Streptomyces umbrinus]|uniref:hypothetical protein n=1 Tax=Streptomyces umbrinus TaxID=67370 RepID=UPI003C2B233D